MFRLVEKSRIPTVGFCMGDIGIPSRILAGRYGAPFTYATFTHERVLAPASSASSEMTEVYQYDRDQPPDGDLLRDRRSRGTQPQPPDPQRGLSGTCT